MGQSQKLGSAMDTQQTNQDQPHKFISAILFYPKSYSPLPPYLIAFIIQKIINRMHY